jgi:HSP20 family protein
MSSLIRWNPDRELRAMDRMMERFFGEPWPSFFNRFMERFEEAGIALDMTEDDKVFTVQTELPGVDPKHITINVSGDYLTIEAEIPETVEEKKDDKRTLIRERRYGKFSRAVRLPQPVDSSKADAHFDNGVLTLTLPKSEPAKSKAIQVKIGKK